MSAPGSPSTIQRDSARPTPPPWLKPAITPQATQKFFKPRIGPISGLPSGANVNGPFTTFLMPAGAQPRKVREAHFQTRRDALQIIRQQILTEVPGRVHRRPRNAGAFVSAHEHAAALLAQVDFAFEVDAVQLFLLACQFRHVAGDQVLMFHRQDGQFESDHAPHFARPQTRGIHDMFGVHVALIGNHVPGTVGAGFKIRNPGMTHDFSAAELRGFCVGVGNAIRIDVTFNRIVHRACEMLFLEQRKQRRRLVDRNDLQIHAKIPAARLGHLEPIEPFAGTGQHQAAGDVHAAGLAGNALDFLVQLDGVLLQLGNIGIAVDGVHAPRRMPGRT